MPSVSMQKAKKVKKHILDLYQTQQKTIQGANQISLPVLNLKFLHNYRTICITH